MNFAGCKAQSVLRWQLFRNFTCTDTVVVCVLTLVSSTGFCVQRDNTLVFWTIQIRKGTFLFSFHFASPAELNIIQIVAIVWLCGMILNDVELTFISVKHLSIRQRPMFLLFSDVNSNVAWVIWPPCSTLSCWTRVCPHSCLKNCVVYFILFFLTSCMTWVFLNNTLKKKVIVLTIWSRSVTNFLSKRVPYGGVDA